MTILLVETSEGVTLRVEVAGAGSRLAAGLLDGMLLVLAALVLALGITVLGKFDAATASHFLLGLLLGGFLIGVIVYHVAFHVWWNGQTPGKRALGIRVAAADGGRATPLQILIRGLVQPIDVLLQLPVSIGLVVIAVTERRQRLGDIAAGTIVVRDEVREPVLDPFPGERWGSAPRTLALTPERVGRLTRDERALLQAVVTRDGLGFEARREIFVDTARHFAARLELGEFVDARVVLKELFLYVREASDGQVPAPFSGTFGGGTASTGSGTFGGAGSGTFAGDAFRKAPAPPPPAEGRREAPPPPTEPPPLPPAS